MPEALVIPRSEEALCSRHAPAKLAPIAARHEFAGLL